MADSTPSIEKTGASDSGSARRYSGAVLEEMREHYFPLMQNTRRAAQESRDFLAGRKGIELPETIQLAGKDAWIGDLPGKKTIPQRVLQKAISKQWEIKRSVTTGGYSAASVSTRLEQPLLAIMKDKKAGVPWQQFNDLLLNEALAFGTVSLAPTDYRQAPSLYDNNGEDIAKRFRLDSSGNLEGDDGFTETDLTRAKNAAEAERHDFLARRIPFRQDAYSIRSCAPIWGPRAELEGLIIESFWSSWRLDQMGITASSDKAGARLYPLGPQNGDASSTSFASGGKQIKVIEAWLTDADGMPYISRHAAEGDAKYLWKDGKPWVVDLAKIAKDDKGDWQGFSRLPVSWGWGLGWPAADLDDRGLTFIEPFWRSWRNIDSLLTSMIIFCMWRGTPALIEKTPLGNVGLDDEETNVPDIQPLKITRVTGEIMELGTQGVAPAVGEAVAIMKGEIGSEAPGQSGDGANSGFQASLNEAFEDKALTTCSESALSMVGQHASFILEGAKIVGECYEPIRVYQISEVLIEQDKPSSTNQLLILEPGLIGSSFDVDCVKKVTPGENPAVRQQNADLVERQLMSQYTFLEMDGNPAPEAELNRIEFEQLSKSDQGQAFRLSLVKQYVDDLFINQLQEAIAGKQANQQGLPNGLATGVPQGPPQGALPPGGAPPPGGPPPPGAPAQGGMSGLGVPNPAAASLAGAVGGAMSNGPAQAALNAGGVVPPNRPGMGG